MENIPLHLKYRPDSLDGVIGQTEQVRSLKAVLSSNAIPSAFLLTGSSGLGKTTIARIIADHFDCEVKEIDVASNNSAEHAREMVESLERNSLFSTKGKFVILDEVHTASKVFFNVLLKTLEEPPSRTAFALCTTDPAKIPATIVTRCHQIKLLDVSVTTLQSHLDEISKKEGITLPKGATKQIALASKGSVRQSLVYLSACREIDSLDDLAVLLAQESIDDISFSMVRELARRHSSPVKIIKMVKAVQENGTNPVAVHAMMKGYFFKMFLSADSDETVFRLTRIMDCLIHPIYEWTELVVAIGKILEIQK